MEFFNDTANSQLPNDLSMEDWISLSILCSVTLMAIGGNLFFVLCIICNTSLQRPGHFFIASLAITDLLLALTVMVPRLSEDILGVWHFGFLMCQVQLAMDVTLCTSSILHLGCISIDRYMAVVDRPLLYEERVTHFKVILAIIGCWIMSGLTGFLPVFTGIYSNPEHLENLMKNSAATCDLVVNKYFSVIAGCISFWLPGSVMTYVYIQVYQETRRLSKYQDPDQTYQLASISSCLHPEQKQEYQSQREESRATLTLGIVMGVFVICWLPFFIWMPLTSLFELQTPPFLYKTILWVGYCNSAVNPFIYGIFCKEFREVITSIKIYPCPWCSHGSIKYGT